MCYTQVYTTQELTGLVNNYWNPQVYTTQESLGLVNKLKLSGIHYPRELRFDHNWRPQVFTTQRTEMSFVAPEPSSRPKPDLTNTPTGTGLKEAEGSKQNMQ